MGTIRLTWPSCVQGESGGSGGNTYFRAYVNRYYSGVGCQDIGPAVAVGEQLNSPFFKLAAGQKLLLAATWKGTPASDMLPKQPT